LGFPYLFSPSSDHLLFHGYNREQLSIKKQAITDNLIHIFMQCDSIITGCDGEYKGKKPPGGFAPAVCVL
jgi:hypothetical protein